MHKNEIRLYNVISWDVPSLEALVKQTITCAAGTPLQWYWADKVGNTAMFGLYLKYLKHYGKNPKEFQGSHPHQFIHDLFQALPPHK